MSCFQISCCAADIGKWETFPINVYIKSQPKNELAIQAFNTWDNAAAARLFNFVESPSNASITFEYQSGGKTNKQYCKQGNTNIKNYRTYVNGKWSPNYIKSAAVTVLEKSCNNGAVLDDKALLQVNIHEIGHALGLVHSTYRADIMYPSVTVNNGNVPDLDMKNDVLRLKKKYGLK